MTFRSVSEKVYINGSLDKNTILFLTLDSSIAFILNSCYVLKMSGFKILCKLDSLYLGINSDGGTRIIFL